jgi:CelD/BcsL family acetyltransferase involved in cellulose biosynthesis
VKGILKVKEYNDFEILKDEWNDFLNGSVENNVFSTWEWLSTWWRHFGEGKKLVILLIEEEKRVSAIAPFVFSKHNFLGFGNLDKISFVGSPESDYNSFVLKERNLKFLELFFDYLTEHFDWDYLELEDVPEDGPSMDLIRGLPLKTLYKNWEERQSSLCPYLPLPFSMDVLIGKLGRMMRYNLKRYSSKLEREHRVELKEYDEFGSVKEAMQIFFNLHQKRWESSGELGAFNTQLFRDFHVDLATCFAKKGWLSLDFLTVDDKPVAAKYCFKYNQKAYVYLGGWDPDYSRYRVGTLSAMYEIEKCIQGGLREYDMMRGNEPYKRLWTTKARRNLELRFVRKGFSSRLYCWLTKKKRINILLSKLGLTNNRRGTKA